MYLLAFVYYRSSALCLLEYLSTTRWANKKNFPSKHHYLLKVQISTYEYGVWWYLYLWNTHEIHFPLINFSASAIYNLYFWAFKGVRVASIVDCFYSKLAILLSTLSNYSSFSLTCLFINLASSSNASISFRHLLLSSRSLSITSSITFLFFFNSIKSW